MSTWQLALMLLGAGWASAQSAGSILGVSIPITVPSGASDTINKGFPGFGIAVHAFQNYAGNSSSPNIFSKNLISNIGQRTGTQVRIRVGGTSGDNAQYVPSQDQGILFPPNTKPGSIPRGLKLGVSYFEGFSSFPNVLWTYMAHFAQTTPGAMENSVATVQAFLKNIDPAALDAIEIGNEIDLYAGTDRPKSWSVQDYIDEWKGYVQAIKTQALANTPFGNGPIFQSPVYFGHQAPWLISNTFSMGINDAKDIKYSSLHCYMVNNNYSTSTTLAASFMNHTAIVGNLSYFSEPVAWLKQNQPGVSLVLGETNSDTYSMDNQAYIGVFGSALWLVDFMLYGASIGISRMSIQLSTGFAYTAWNPVDYYGSPPAVYPPYYGQVFVADVIGSGDDVRIANIDLNLDQFSAYGVYDAASGALTKIALVNLREWNTTTSYPRPTTNVLLSLDGGNAPSWTNWPSSYRVQRLTAPGAESLTNITWAGQEFTYESNGMPNPASQSSEAVWGLGGWLNVGVQASEAVLITL